MSNDDPIRGANAALAVPKAMDTEASSAVTDPGHGEPHASHGRLAFLALAALGVVFGDIGTSVLYTLKECFNPVRGVKPTVENVYGVLSLVIWTLTLIVSVKYVLFIMRADNRGEGGILALLALILQRAREQASARRTFILITLGLFGAALLYGDGVITPAITVLSAIEGLEVATPVFSPFVVPLSAIILLLLFLLQQRGTERIGRIFGPVMLVWFGAISIFGLLEIVHEPGILRAVSPWYGVNFFAHNGWFGFLILGSVVLAVTGAEALYADMGHFGRTPIRAAWFWGVFPALLLNYFGQGALLLRDPSAVENPFFHLVPQPLLYPMVVLATAAAVIASQALISGAFSLTQQALQLGYTPRVTIRHTSEEVAGQIYIPEVNAALAIGCIGLVLGFRSSDALAAAYGIAVTGTMVATTVLFYVIARSRFAWKKGYALAFLAIFLTIDLAFFVANIFKFTHGGWFPVVVALALFTLMSTWKRGRMLLQQLLRSASLPLDLFLADVEKNRPTRVPGTAVFMTSDTYGVPAVLLHHLKHNKVLHRQVVLLTATTADVPYVPDEQRMRVEPLGVGFYRIVATYGFMQTPNIPEIMQRAPHFDLDVRPGETTYYLGREQLIPSGTTRMALWRKKLFVIMARNARPATQYFGLPPNRVVELGTQIVF